MQRKFKCGVLVVGGGIAACFAAIRAAEAGARVIMADKGTVGRSGQTPYADCFLVFQKDRQDLAAAEAELARHSEYLNDRYWTRLTLLESEARYRDLLEWGCRFHRPPLKDPGQALTGVQLDRSAGDWGGPLRNKCLAMGVEILDRVMIVELLRRNGRVCGAVGLPAEETEPVTILAGAVILCVGACGYKPNGYPALIQLTGDGEAMAYRAGAAIMGKEFPDAHYSREGAADPMSQRGMRVPVLEKPGLHSEALRHRENCFGDVISGRPEGVSEYMFTYTQSEFEVHSGRAPIFNLGAEAFGGATLGMSVRKADGLWPADHECRSTVPGLFAAGDSLATMQNGAAYSLGGGSVAGCAVTGAVAGEAAAREAAALPELEVSGEELRRVEEYALAPLVRRGGFGPRWTIELLKSYMSPYFVYFIKKADRLEAALTLVRFMREHIAPMLRASDAHELRLAHEAESMILSAEMRLRSSLFRTESRGNHYREDFPMRDDDNWLCWTKIEDRDGEMVLSKVPLPEEWRPDRGLRYRERYPMPFPGEER